MDRLGRWLRGPRAARAIEGGSGAALTAPAPAPAPATGRLLH